MVLDSAPLAERPHDALLAAVARKKAQITTWINMWKDVAPPRIRARAVSSAVIRDASIRILGIAVWPRFELVQPAVRRALLDEGPKAPRWARSRRSRR